MATETNNSDDERIESFGDRLKQASLEAGAEKKTHEYLRDWFLSEHGISISTAMISRYSGKGELPHMQQCRDYAVALGVCVEWLYTGRGAKYPTDGPTSRSQRRLMKMWKRMNAGCKYAVFSEAVKARLMPDLHGDQSLTETQLEEKADQIYMNAKLADED